MISNVRRTEIYRELKQIDEPVVFAVSGGPDSLAMLHLFDRLQNNGKLNCEICVGHVQHDLREEGPDEDRRFVRTFARRRDLSFQSRRITVREDLKNSSVSPEEIARRKRYEALRDICGDVGSSTLVTAHHRDDQVQTILLRILNGTGIQGLCGIRARRTMSHPDGNEEPDRAEEHTVTLLRPLLPVSKQSIYDYLQKHNISWRVDPSNRELHLQRNYVRLKIVPYIRKLLDRDFPDLLLRIRNRACQIDEKLRSRWSENRLSYQVSDGRLVINRQDVVDLSTLLHPYFLRWVKRRLSLENTIRYHDFRRLRSLVKKEKTGQEETLSGGLLLRLEHNVLVAESEHTPIGIREDVQPEVVTIPGRTEWAAWKIGVTPVHGRINPLIERYRDTEWEEVVDVSRIRGSVRVTSRRPGDSLKPVGFNGHKKLKNMMVDRKIPRSERDRWPVLRDQAGIVWVPGIRLADRVRLRTCTRAKNMFLLSCDKEFGDPLSHLTEQG